MNDVSLIKKALDGDRPSRQQISEIAHPIICYQASKLCKQFCHSNRYQYKCSLPDYAFPAFSQNSPLCEWGNGSYGWMLDDLAKDSRLQKFEGKDGAQLKDYFFTIANSLPFKERWKDWRLGRRVNVPLCVQRIDDKASKVFFGIYNKKSIEDIAQQMGEPVENVEIIADQIIINLTQENKLHVLSPPSEVSLTGLGMDRDSEEDHEHQGHIPVFDIDAADSQQQQMIATIWRDLSPVEQFIVEQMIIDEQDANSVLEALIQTGISIKEGTPPEAIDRQQLYHFKRKTLKKITIALEKQNNP